MHFRISKDLSFSDPEIGDILDRSNPNVNIFKISIPLEKREEVYKVIKHYLKKGIE